jgi:hypothetical protein
VKVFFTPALCHPLTLTQYVSFKNPRMLGSLTIGLCEIQYHDYSESNETIPNIGIEQPDLEEKNENVPLFG